MKREPPSTLLPRAPIDIAKLTPRLRYLARRYGRYFPRHILDHHDLTQIAWLGMLSLMSREGERKSQLMQRQVHAGKCEIIDALRRFDGPPPYRKHLETLVEDIKELAEAIGSVSPDDHVAHDVQALIAQLPLRDQVIILGRLRGITQAELGLQLGLTESRICQIEKRIVAELREVV